MIEFKGKYTTAKVMIDAIDGETSSQIVSFVNDPAFTNPVAIMPDCHAGKGAVIGFTMPITDRIVPNVIGVDIGCGMLSYRLDAKKLNYARPWIDREIRKQIPTGNNAHAAWGCRDKSKPNVRSLILSGRYGMEKSFPWKEFSETTNWNAPQFFDFFGLKYEPLEYDFEWFLEKCGRVGIDPGYAEASVGTLGGGNHFIEVGRDEEDYLWVTVHSGSRNLGFKIAEYWQRRAVEYCETEYRKLMPEKIEKIKATLEKTKWPSAIAEAKRRLWSPDSLKHLSGELAMGYIKDMMFAQRYASINRKAMMERILCVLGGPDVKETIETVHNYIDPFDGIIRKGAIASYESQKMIIPFNMEDGILVCDGRSNKEWNYSAPHGAGRVYSRSEAKRKLNVEVAAESMKQKGVYCSVLPTDEQKLAYKPAEIIEEAIKPTAKVLHRIKPILNLKAN